MDHTKTSAKDIPSVNQALPELRGNACPAYLMDCFARHMLKNWKRPEIEVWLNKNPSKAIAMRDRLNNQKGKRP